MAGDWQTISRKVQPQPEEPIDEKLNVGIRKRKFDDDEEREDAGQTVARKGWGSTTRTYPGSQPVDDDLHALLSLPLVKKEKVKVEPLPDHQIPTSTPSISSADPPVIKSEISDTTDEKLLGVQNTETQVVHATSRPASEIKSETLDTDARATDREPSAPVFKKRKAKLPSAA